MMGRSEHNGVVKLAGGQALGLILLALPGWGHAQTPASSASPNAPAPVMMEEIVISVSRREQARFDAPAAVDAVAVDPFRTASSLVNVSELLSSVPGILARDRQNYAQDLQISVRGFGTRSTFGIRGVRILVDGIPATMPDGQGQVSNASLASAERIEVLRGPPAQQYGNAAGGVIQVFTRDPATDGRLHGRASLGMGSDGLRQQSLGLGGGTRELAADVDVSHFTTDGYRDHSAAERTVINAKVVARPTEDTRITGIFNRLDQPWTDDPLGLTAADAASNPRQSAAVASIFNTRKRVEQTQAGVVVDQRLSSADSLSARAYGGTRSLTQYLSFSGAAANSSGGVVDLDRDFGGLGLSWTHDTRVAGMPVSWTTGVEADRLSERRRGFVNNNGVSGALRRDERDQARNLDVFAHVDWTVSPNWHVLAGLRRSQVKLSVDDDYITPASPDGSGAVTYRNTSPMLGLVWNAREDLNVYANVGKGFETPTLAEAAYSATSPGPNLGLRPARSKQAEVGMKARIDGHVLDLAVFESRSRDEIVPTASVNGRSIFQNVDRVQRRGAEVGWSKTWDPRFSTRLAYTLTHATFDSSFDNGRGGVVAAGKRLPGVPLHSVFAQAEYRPQAPLSLALEWRMDSRIQADDVNTQSAAGYGVLNASAGYEFKIDDTRVYAFARIDNLFDKRYIGSLIVNDSNNRFFEPAPGRRFFAGIRAAF